MAATSLLTALLLALAIAIAAKPVLERKSPLKLPLTKRLSLSNHNVVERNRRRVNSLRRRAGNQDDLESMVVNTLAFFKINVYTVEVGIGDPIQMHNLLLDSGSSLTWAGANKSYVPNTSQHTGNNMTEVYYNGNGFSAYEVNDLVTLGLNFNITNQGIGAAFETHGFEDFDGILGIGPTDLTMGKLIPDTGRTIPTVTDNLYASKRIPENLVVVAFQPFNQSNSNKPGDTILSGELNWGGIDASLYIGDITFAPITKTSPASTSWGIDAFVAYGNLPLLYNAAGIVDTGTTFVLLASEAYNAYRVATGADLDFFTGLLTIGPTQFSQLQGLSFNISGTVFTLTPDAQIMPQYLNVVMGGVASRIYLVVHNSGFPRGEAFDFHFGVPALERFVCVFDTANRQVGFANTRFTNANLNFLNLAD